jgi:hypothetical protein
MFNQDVIDLYSRVPVGSPVVVKNSGTPFDPDEEFEVSSSE